MLLVLAGRIDPFQCELQRKDNNYYCDGLSGDCVSVLSSGETGWRKGREEKTDTTGRRSFVILPLLT